MTTPLPSQVRFNEPELSYRADRGYTLAGLSAAAIKEMKAERDDQKLRISALESEVNDLQESKAILRKQRDAHKEAYDRLTKSDEIDWDIVSKRSTVAGYTAPQVKQLKKERDDAVAQANAMKPERARIMTERDDALTALGLARESRDRLRESRERAVRERDRALATNVAGTKALLERDAAEQATKRAQKAEAAAVVRAERLGEQLEQAQRKLMAAEEEVASSRFAWNIEHENHLKEMRLATDARSKLKQVEKDRDAYKASTSELAKQVLDTIKERDNQTSRAEEFKKALERTQEALERAQQRGDSRALQYKAELTEANNHREQLMGQVTRLSRLQPAAPILMPLPKDFKLNEFLEPKAKAKTRVESAAEEAFITAWEGVTAAIKRRDLSEAAALLGAIASAASTALNVKKAA
jgi:DNA repair exonuclease SbcCD ATPase subunit